MEIPELAMYREKKNRYHIYLFYIDGHWRAFGYSAYYLSILCPVLRVTKETSPDIGEDMPCIHVPESYLAALSEYNDTLVSDDCVRIEAPPTVYCYRKDYGDWCESLNIINANSLF